MWAADKIEIQPRELDFSSSGMGRHATKALCVDGLEVVNALDLADFSEPAQLIVCDCCGTIGCNSGGWVAFRRIGAGLAFIPCFGDMDGGAWESTEFSPPAFMNKKGIPFFSGVALSELRAAVPFFEDLGQFPNLSEREAAQVMQWEAPAAILGRFPSLPAPKSDLVSAVNPGDEKSTLALLADLLARAFSSDAAVIPADGEPVTFYLDLPGYPEWIPLARRGDDAFLTLGAGVSFWIAGSAHTAVAADGASRRR